MNGFGRHGKAGLGKMPIEMVEFSQIKDFPMVWRLRGTEFRAPSDECRKILSLWGVRLQHLPSSPNLT
jgi:hypothetical protein